MIVVVLAIVSDVTGSALAVGRGMRFFHSSNVYHAGVGYVGNRVLFLASRGLFMIFPFSHSLHTEALAVISLIRAQWIILM